MTLAKQHQVEGWAQEQLGHLLSGNLIQGKGWEEADILSGKEMSGFC